MASKQWGIRITFRDGTTRQVGPYGSKREAEDNRPGGPDVIASRTFKFHEDVSGPARLLAEKHTSPKPAKFTVVGVNAPGGVGEVRMTGLGFSNLERWVVYYDSNAESVEFTNPFDTDTDTQVIGTDEALAGQYVSKVELYDGESLKLTVSGLNVLIPGSAPEVSLIDMQDLEFVVQGTGLLNVSQVNWGAWEWPSNTFFGEVLDANPNVVNWTDTEIRIDMTAELVTHLDPIINQVTLLNPGPDVVFNLGPSNRLSIDDGTLNVSIAAPNRIQMGSSYWRNWKVTRAVLHFDDLSTFLAVKGDSAFDNWDDSFFQVHDDSFAGKTLVAVDVLRQHEGDPDAGDDTNESPRTLVPSTLLVPAEAPAQGFEILEGGNGQGYNNLRSIAKDSNNDYFYACDNNFSGGGNQVGILKVFGVDGTVDTSFGNNGFYTANTAGNSQSAGIVIDSNDDIYLGIWEDYFGGSYVKVVKVDPSGSTIGSYGTGGYATLGVDGQSNSPNLEIESDDRVVMAWQQHQYIPNVAHLFHGRLTRLSTSGSVDDEIQFDAEISPDLMLEGMCKLSDGQYAGMLRGSNTGNSYIVRADLDAGSVLDYQSVNQVQIEGVADWGMALNDAGTHVYVVGRDNTYSLARLIRFGGSNFTTYDSSFNGSGHVDFDSNYDVAISSTNGGVLRLIPSSSDFLLTGSLYDGNEGWLWVTRFTAAGAKVYSKKLRISTPGDGAIYDTLIDSYRSCAAHSGYGYTGNFNPMFARTLLALGEFDTNFSV